MITEKQKQKMLECLDANNFCMGVNCDDCPFSGKVYGCEQSRWYHEIEKIKTEPEKKLCPTCGHELDKEIEDD